MTKTDAENAPSDALTAWRKAFFTRNVKAFAEGFAQNVVLEASALRDTTYVYGIGVMALAAMTAVAVWRRRARSATAV